MIKRKWLFSLIAFIAILWISVIAVATWVEHGLNRDRTTATAVSHDLADPADLKIYWDVPAFSFADQDGRTFTNRDMPGHVWVVDFIFTQCTSACPILTSKMLLLQKQLKSTDVQFMSFSVDPGHDTPAALKAYAQLWQADQSRWRLLSTDAVGLTNLTAGMKVTVAPSGDRDNPILHTNLLFLIDTAARVRGIYDSSDSDAIARLEENARALAGNASTTIPTASTGGSIDADRGRLLFGSMGCLACHSKTAIAPPLQNLYGSAVRLDDRRMVWADDAYLHESIVDPSVKVVAGYTKSMPSYHNYLSDSQVMDLVAYVKSISSNPPGGHGIIATAPGTGPVDIELMIDPVCKMQVTKDPSAPHAECNGKTYFFCSDHCRDQFLRTPQAFSSNANQSR